MKYRLYLTTEKQWRQLYAAGPELARVGIHDVRADSDVSVEPGDILLCFLYDLKRWVGVLSVLEGPDDWLPYPGGPGTREEPVPTCTVLCMAMTDPEHGLAMTWFAGRLSFYRNRDDENEWLSAVSGSLNEFVLEDGRALAEGIDAAARACSRLIGSPLPPPVRSGYPPARPRISSGHGPSRHQTSGRELSMSGV